MHTREIKPTSRQNDIVHENTILVYGIHQLTGYVTCILQAVLNIVDHSSNVNTNVQLGVYVIICIILASLLNLYSCDWYIVANDIQIITIIIILVD